MNNNHTISIRKLYHPTPNVIDVLTSERANWYVKTYGLKETEYLVCFHCRRYKFSHPDPHKCNTGFRKKKLLWFVSDIAISLSDKRHYNFYFKI